MKNTEIASKELMNMNCFSLPINAKDFSRCTFWYYTKLKTANLILENCCFHCRNFEEMNDRREYELHGENGKYIHALCFCNSNSEKIPMWYLYSGISGNGVSLGLTPSVMLKFIASIKNVTTPTGTNLQKDKDFDVEYGWIFYRKQDNLATVKYKGEWYSLIDSDVSVFERNNNFVKDYPWEYEKEFRIIIKNKTEIVYDKLIIDIPKDILKLLKIRYAPELTESTFLNLLPELKGFQKTVFTKNEHSKLSICMNLHKRNSEDIIDNIPQIITQHNAKKICSQIKSTNFCGDKGENQ